ncbi:MAG: hypothetical protein C0614_03355 [Desulfuromonas sp.]|nr:MAG: hypothetical protein C0614_03355 [Desulfuromonas sp.]
MNLDGIWELLQNFETTKVVGYLQEADLQKLIKSPYFLGSAATLAIVALVMKWRLLLTVVMFVTGFVYLLTYTIEQGTSLEGGITNDTLAVFIGGGAVLVFLAIYLLFIRND